MSICAFPRLMCPIEPVLGAWECLLDGYIGQCGVCGIPRRIYKYNLYYYSGRSMNRIFIILYPDTRTQVLENMFATVDDFRLPVPKMQGVCNATMHFGDDTGSSGTNSIDICNYRWDLVVIEYDQTPKTLV